MLRRIDCHIHVIGNGSSGSGARVHFRTPLRRLFGRILVSNLGLPADSLSGPLDELYRDKLVEWADQSPLDHVVLLAHEHAYTREGRAILDFGSMFVPNDYVFDLLRSSRKFLAGISIHPGRPDALRELDRCVDRGAALMKCLPNCQNIDCSDPAYRPFWERMARLGLPLLAHTGGELSLPVYDSRFADPKRLELPLQCGVHVIAAHCGTRSHLWDANYLEAMEQLMSRFPNLFADNSGMQTPFRSRHLKTLLQAPFRSRMLHGSDLPIPISGFWSALRGHLRWTVYKSSREIRNPLIRDIHLKRGMEFSEETFDRITRILPAYLTLAS